MGFDDLAKSIGHQLAVVASAPVPFAVCVLLVAIAIWRAMAWRYDSINARLVADVAYLERALARDMHLHATKVAVPSEPPLVGSKALAKEPRATAPVVTEREFVDQASAVQIIFSARRTLSGIQADRIIESYNGKWMKVTGTVFASGIRSGEIFVSLTHDEAAPIRERLERQVTLWFPETSAAVEDVKIGDTLTGQGRIERVDELGFILTDAEVLT